MTSPIQFDCPFPVDFTFGVATAAYQIEGAVSDGGRGASIWDTFSHTKGKVHNGDTGDIACDHYHRWPNDLDLIASLGIPAYRFSIAWPRLFPTGRGPINTQGLDFYDRLMDGCLERGIALYPTLYHWDMPQALADKGGWSNRSTSEYFADYAQTVMNHFGDRVSAVTTFNEPWCSAILGHLIGIHAPGEKNLDAALSVVHGQHLAHGMAIQAMRAAKSDIPLGIVLNVQSVYPLQDNDSDRAAAERHEQFHNSLFLDPLFTGRYPDEIVKKLGSRLPEQWQADLPIIHQTLDYWGLNYYTPAYVTSSSKKEAEYPATDLIARQGRPKTDIGWEVDASTFYDLLVSLNDRYDLPPCYITENGAAYNHDVEDGKVADQPRTQYLYEHINAVSRAIESGVDIKGYFAWSLMDNFEWAEGYTMRFGLIHVDYDTQTRTVKDSGKWYQSVIEQHRSLTADS